ncbi:hypothetical protein TNIN_388221 [Trichonephila inaurata madagascariensis]|uniref:Uncharacterized protein n=1 Tax=Trichonephila inaurata madagascariensis TaxID=2747483 RepID=A0A8X7C4J1_9ARAC|nr:hypothetical protein TNIN_388221 [Trichonephila inaurata madagascariensis]
MSTVFFLDWLIDAFLGVGKKECVILSSSTCSPDPIQTPTSHHQSLNCLKGRGDEDLGRSLFHARGWPFVLLTTLAAYTFLMDFCHDLEHLGLRNAQFISNHSDTYYNITVY